MLIDKRGIARLIPHAGDMCLLDGVMSWNDTRIECLTGSHRVASNPLRRDGRLGILCGVEYAAQAMALHGALVGAHTGGEVDIPHRGFLASLRGIRCHADRLDLTPGFLLVDAEHMYGEAGRVMYRFALRHKDRILLSGRAAVVIEG